jgi:hypothetical protein
MLGDVIAFMDEVVNSVLIGMLGGAQTVDVVRGLRNAFQVLPGE